MWDLPGPGLKPVSPALAGGFLTTAPPGKSGVAFVRAGDVLLGLDGSFVPSARVSKQLSEQPLASEHPGRHPRSSSSG